MEEKMMVKKIKMNYDNEADVLYINFGVPRPADDSDITDEGVIIRLNKGKIIGLSILNAGKRIKFASQ